MLSARFAAAKRDVEGMLADDRTFLTGIEIEAPFRRELEQELARNLGDAFSNQSHSRFMDENARPLAEAYRINRRPDRPHTLSKSDHAELAKRGVDNCDMTAIEEYLADYC
ncbi:MAG: hypothetical protein PGN23_07330 [Sphingomonas adhaesiva]|uniref:hypothetical protein n=1 Tax=Sphingomonas adhaesiva TaxID=28212 RepID=UPI002FFAA800